MLIDFKDVGWVAERSAFLSTYKFFFGWVLDEWIAKNEALVVFFVSFLVVTLIFCYSCFKRVTSICRETIIIYMFWEIFPRTGQRQYPTGHFLFNLSPITFWEFHNIILLLITLILVQHSNTICIFWLFSLLIQIFFLKKHCSNMKFFVYFVLTLKISFYPNFFYSSPSNRESNPAPLELAELVYLRQCERCTNHSFSSHWRPY
jgi:hypothetical protein